MRKNAPSARRPPGPDALEIPPNRRRRQYFGRVERRMTTAVALGLFVGAVAFHFLLAVAVQGVLNMSWAGGQLPAGDGFMAVSLLPEEGEPAEDPAEDPLENRKDEKLVQNHRLLNEDRPDETNKVSEFDHTVDKEQRAPNVRDATPTPESMRGDSPDADQAEKDGDSKKQPTDQEAESESDHGKGRSAIDSLFDAYDDGEVSKEAGASSNSGKTGLRGSAQDLARTFGRHGSLDSLEDVEEGGENLLNTKRTKFASFFNRVRNAVAQHWHPEVVHAARDPYGKVYGSKTRTTRLRISLNQDGSVHRIWVDRPSGVDYLDEEAIRAVRAAAPFTNPPRQLADPETGMVDFSFNFILMIDGSKRIFRYKR